MRETRQSGSEGGVGLIPHPYPYRWRLACATLIHEDTVQFQTAIGITRLVAKNENQGLNKRRHKGNRG